MAPMATRDVSRDMSSKKFATADIRAQYTGGVALQHSDISFEDEGVSPTSNAVPPFDRSDRSDTTEDVPIHGNGAALPKMQATAPAFMPAKTKKSSKPAPIQILNLNSMSDEPTIVASPGVKLYDQRADKRAVAGVIQPIGTGALSASPVKRGFFTTDIGADVVFQGTRYLVIDNVPYEDMKNEGILAIFRQFEYPQKTLCTQYKAHNNGLGTFYFVFDDIRDTATAVEEIPMISGNWDEPRLIFQQEFHTVFADEAQILAIAGNSLYEGQVTFTASYEGRSSAFKPDDVQDAIIKYAGYFGEIRHYVQLDTELPKLACRVEYFQLSAAKAVVNTTKEHGARTVGRLSIMAEEYAPPGYESPVRTIAPEANLDLVEQRMRELGLTNTPKRDHALVGRLQASPTGRTYFRVDDYGNEIISTLARPYLPAVDENTPLGYQYEQSGRWMRGSQSVNYAPLRHFSAPPPQTPSGQILHGVNMAPRSDSWAGHVMTRDNSGGHQRNNPDNAQNIVLAKIRNGQDVRTTVMLRNIPNDATCHHIKAMLDRTSLGEYDFSYLRIDFRSNKNVGYAFINFVDPSNIIAFYEKNVGVRWCEMGLSIPMRESQLWKMAEASYATCQGIDGLIEKFRNSSILEEGSDYRPKLWYTAYDMTDASLIGTEKAWPGLNNMTKARRSRDNAGVSGLFAPGSGYRGRDGRAFQSRYDRGTPAQMREDSYYNGQVSPMTAMTPSSRYQHRSLPRGARRGNVQQASPYPPMGFNAMAVGQPYCAPPPSFGGYGGMNSGHGLGITLDNGMASGFPGSFQQNANGSTYATQRSFSNRRQNHVNSHTNGMQYDYPVQSANGGFGGGFVTVPSATPRRIQGQNDGQQRQVESSNAGLWNGVRNLHDGSYAGQANGGRVSSQSSTQPGLTGLTDITDMLESESFLGQHGDANGFAVTTQPSRS